MAASTELRSFQTTRWSVVRRAVETDGAEAGRALVSLCENYWFPIYAYFRRVGKNPPDAEDLTQGFFVRLLANDLLAFANPEKGRLRTFLLACARNYSTDVWEHDSARKRGGGVPVLPFDPRLAEERYAAEAVDSLTPDRLFQRRWALAILDQALAMLKAEYYAREQGELFETLRPFLGFGLDPEKHYKEISESLAIPVGTLKNRVFRMRERWRELLFEQVALTLENPTPEEIRAELSELLGCV